MEQMRLMTMYVGRTVQRIGKLRVSLRKMKALTVKTETVTLIGKVR
jgi:hypothetical protein